MYLKGIKRILDIVFGLSGLILLSPVFLIIAVMVRIKLGSPVLFAQKRPGYQEKIFRMYKFRTMSDQKDDDGNLLSDGERLTKFGSLLRSTSMDELPELLNIVKGDMSMIGPRPLLVGYLPLYSEEQKHRHDVKPGLTGWAQVNGRNAISWKEKFAYDVWYVNHLSFSLDLRIFFMTIRKVFVREGISGVSSETMEPFAGSESK